MRRAHASLLACPDCHGELAIAQVDRESDGSVDAGMLSCSKCDGAFPIVRGVPRFVSSDNYAAQFGFQWARHPLLQYDSYNGLKVSETRFFEQTGWPRHMQGEMMLEVGCGAGRFTEPAVLTGATLVSVDCSEAVDVNYTNHRPYVNLLIVQADVYRLPLRTGSFDRVFCFGVIQHTPDPRRAVSTLTTFLKPEGLLAIDVYLQFAPHKRWLDTKHWARPLTSRMQPERLYRIVNRYVRAMWPVARLVHRIPYIGMRLNWKLLIADYRGRLPLPEDLLREWAILDTFDMLGAVYDYPQFASTVDEWLCQAGLAKIEVTTQNALVVARAQSARPKSETGTGSLGQA